MIEKIGDFAIISFLFSIIRTMLGDEKKNPVRYFLAAFIAVPVGVIAGHGASDYGFSQGATFATVAVMSLLSENLVTVVINLGVKIQKNPKEVINTIRSIIGK